MIKTIKNQDGYVYAYIVFHVVDEEGKLRRDGGFGYIQDLWIHDMHRRKTVLPKLIHMVNEELKDYKVDWIYWRNDKHSRVTKNFSKQRLSKMGERECI